MSAFLNSAPMTTSLHIGMYLGPRFGIYGYLQLRMHRRLLLSPPQMVLPQAIVSTLNLPSCPIFSSQNGLWEWYYVRSNLPVFIGLSAASTKATTNDPAGNNESESDWNHPKPMNLHYPPKRT